MENTQLTRRELLRWGLAAGVTAVAGLATGVVQGDELSYLLTKGFAPKAQPHESTVLFAKLLDKDTDTWQVGGGPSYSIHHPNGRPQQGNG